jgi:serine/threonine-protein kinase
VAKCGYIAIDLNDNSILYNFDTDKIKICDIDFYVFLSYMNGMGSIFGIKTLMSPEECRCAGLIDEVTNAYTMGAMAFLLLARGDRSADKWPLDMKLFDVIDRAVNNTRRQRQNSIGQLIDEWNNAKRNNYERR